MLKQIILLHEATVCRARCITS